MITIDGKKGEGGGQVLRTSLAVSMVTGQPVRVMNIRAGRPNSGLMRQHLTAVMAAAEICGGHVQGAGLRSTDLTFHPGKVTGGDYAFRVGTAGSTTLLLQTLLPALVTAPERSTLSFEGGTHNPFAPPFEFIAEAFVPILEAMGPSVRVYLDRSGFFPAGGGRIRVEVEPTERLRGLSLLRRGVMGRCGARAVVAALPVSIAKRELAVVRDRMGWHRQQVRAERIEDGDGPGNVVLLTLQSERITEVFTGFGQWRVRAELVAEQACAKARAYLDAHVPVGEHLADQLLLYLALAGGGAFRSTSPTKHTLTQARVVEELLGVRTRIENVSDNGWLFEVG